MCSLFVMQESSDPAPDISASASTREDRIRLPDVTDVTAPRGFDSPGHRYSNRLRANYFRFSTWRSVGHDSSPSPTWVSQTWDTLPGRGKQG